MSFRCCQGKKSHSVHVKTANLIFKPCFTPLGGILVVLVVGFWLVSISKCHNRPELNSADKTPWFYPKGIRRPHSSKFRNYFCDTNRKKHRSAEVQLFSLCKELQLLQIWLLPPTNKQESKGTTKISNLLLQAWHTPRWGYLRDGGEEDDIEKNPRKPSPATCEKGVQPKRKTKHTKTQPRKSRPWKINGWKGDNLINLMAARSL